MATIDLNHEVICVSPTDDLTLYDKNHITSRIEKFLFAICSLDSSDLPVPLSRIEELYNCLVTGDTPPTFEPSSRAEKFLMACLGVYDINKLPEPLSRSEVLLKKIATGDSNLEDVDNLQSKYEFLLAYIIQNGGVGDFEKYVLNTQFNTLYNTKEKPIKSAILTGNTLVNKLGLRTSTTNATNVHHVLLNLTRLTPPIAVGESTIFFFECDFPNPSTDGYIEFYTHKNGQPSWIGAQQFLTRQNGKCSTIIKNTFDVQIDYVDIYISNATQGTHILDNMMIITRQEGIENWDIPYFKGMSSVKMPVLKTTGKNILNINENNFYEFLIWGDNGSTPVEYIENEKAFYTSTHRMLRLRNLKPNKTYTLSFDVKRVSSGDFCALTYFNDYVEEIGLVTSENNGYIRKYYTFATTENKTKIDVTFYNTVYFKNLQLVEGTITEYEPYKSNILTCNEEVTLRGVGDVQDELNLLTGEVVERIGEIVLDGSEAEWVDYSETCFVLRGHYFSDSVEINNILIKIAICDKFEWGGASEPNTFRIYNQSNVLWAMFGKSYNTQTLEDFKSWLQANPITIQYQLKTPTVKTVDLSIVNQDGNNTKLSTFNDITHVTLSSEGLIPKAELEVATKNEEVLNTLSLEMDDISASQTTLEETTNTQNENVDATMIATTEIYEGLL